MSLLEYFGLKPKAAKVPDQTTTTPTTTPATAAAAAREDVLKLAARAGMTADEAEVFADDAAGKKLALADVADSLMGAVAATAQAKAKEADAAKANAESARAQADAATKAAAESKAAADAERAKLADTNLKLGDAGKGVDPKDAPAVVVAKAAPGAVKIAAAAPESASSLPPGAGGALRLNLDHGALWCGNAHPFEQAVTERVRAGSSVAAAVAAVSAADRALHADFGEWMAKNLPR